MTRLFTAGMLITWVTSTGTHAFARGVPAGSPPNAVQRCLALNLDAALFTPPTMPALSGSGSGSDRQVDWGLDEGLTERHRSQAIGADDAETFRLDDLPEPRAKCGEIAQAAEE
jgi:hypothetical protein